MVSAAVASSSATNCGAQRELDSTPLSNKKDCDIDDSASLHAPTARSSSTFLATKSGSLIIFGGEFYDDKICKVYNDTYKLSAVKTSDLRNGYWKVSRNGTRPKMRVAHHAVVKDDDIYVFGGECSTKKDFDHFRDFWKLDTKSLQWEEIKTDSPKDAPSARSGHRMVLCRNMIVVFGGYNDSRKSRQYFNDIHLYNITSRTWRSITLPKHAPKPDPRSGFAMAATENGAWIYGGFRKVKENKNEVQGKIIKDSWWLDMTSVFADPENSIPVWTSIPAKGSPIRTGYSVAQRKHLVYLFGGVLDADDGGFAYEASIFFNDMYCFDLNTREWSHLGLNGYKASEHSGYYVYNKNLRKFTFDAKRPFDTILKNREYDEDCSKRSKRRQAEESNTVLVMTGETVPIKTNAAELTEPLPRYQASVCIEGNYLYVFGGSLELEKRTIVFDDIWRLHLKALKWENVYAGRYWTDGADDQTAASASRKKASTASSSSDGSYSSDSCETSDTDESE